MVCNLNILRGCLFFFLFIAGKSFSQGVIPDTTVGGNSGNKEISKGESNTNVFPTLLGPAKLQHTITGLSLKNRIQKPFFRVERIEIGAESIFLPEVAQGQSTIELEKLKVSVNYYGHFDLSFAGLPFDFAYQLNDGIVKTSPSQLMQLRQFNFNHSKYLEKIKSGITDKINPGEILTLIGKRIKMIQDQYEEQLRKEIEETKHIFFTKNKMEMVIPEDIHHISLSDFTSLRTRLIPQALERKYKEALERSGGGISDNGADSVRRKMYREWEAIIEQKQLLEDIFHKIQLTKERFENNPVVKSLKDAMPGDGDLKKYMAKPGNVVKMVKSMKQLCGIQRLFLHLTKLDLGKNAVGEGALQLQSVLNNGINSMATFDQTSFGFLTGSGNGNINQLLQAGLGSFVSNEYSGTKGFKAGTGWNSKQKQTVSFQFYDFTESPEVTGPDLLSANYLTAPGRRDAVITWNSEYKVGDKHSINGSLSTSLGSYRSTFSSDSSVSKSNAFSDIFSGSGSANYAAAADYTGEILQTQFSIQLKSVGLGYNNPGNILLRRGENKVGVSFSKKLMKSKLSVKYKADYRRQHFDPEKNYRYLNFSNHLQASYRFRKNRRIGLHWRHNSYEYRGINYPSSTGSSSSVQLDGTCSFTIFGKKLMTNAMVIRQQFDVPLLTGGSYSSQTWMVSQHSSIAFENRLLDLAIQYNRSDNKDYYFNTSFFNTEINYSYSGSAAIRLSSGAGVYLNQGWNRQIGVKQQISGTVLKKIDIALDISYRKAVTVIRKELADQFFAQSSIHYRF